jgi:hypothetical protein
VFDQPRFGRARVRNIRDSQVSGSNQHRLAPC